MVCRPHRLHGCIAPEALAIQENTTMISVERSVAAQATGLGEVLMIDCQLFFSPCDGTVHLRRKNRQQSGKIARHRRQDRVSRDSGGRESQVRKRSLTRRRRQSSV
jgi:hypothetical protein